MRSLDFLLFSLCLLLVSFHICSGMLKYHIMDRILSVVDFPNNKIIKWNNECKTRSLRVWRNRIVNNYKEFENNDNKSSFMCGFFPLFCRCANAINLLVRLSFFFTDFAFVFYRRLRSKKFNPFSDHCCTMYRNIVATDDMDDMAFP